MVTNDMFASEGLQRDMQFNIQPPLVREIKNITFEMGKVTSHIFFYTLPDFQF